MSQRNHWVGWTAILAVVSLAVGTASRAGASTPYYWAPSGSSLGGDGTWDDSSPQWYDGSTYTTWADGQEADFTDASGTVLNTSDRTVNGLVFTVGGYTIGASGTSGAITTGGANAINVTADSGATTIYSPLMLSSDGTITNASSGSLTIAGVISGGYSLTKAGNGTLVLSSRNVYTGATIVNAGTLAIKYYSGGYGALVGSSGATINNGGTIRVDTTNAFGNGYTSVNPPITVAAGGLLTMSSGLCANVSSLTLQGGTVACIGSPNSSYGSWTLDGNINVQGTTASTMSAANMNLAKSGGVTFTVDADSTLNVTGNFCSLNGTAALIKAGGGTMTLSAKNTYTGATIVNGGTLALKYYGGGYGTLANSSGVTINNGGTLRVDATNAFGNGSVSLNPPITVASGGLLTMGSGLVAHVGALNLQGGTVSCIGTPNTSYGSWVIDKDVTVSGGAVSTMSATQMSLNKTGGVTFNVASDSALNVTGTFTVNTGLGAADLIKAGGGTMILSGANTYTGATTVSAGCLTVTNVNALPNHNTSGKVTVQSNAALAATNASDFEALAASAVTFNSGSYIGIDTRYGDITYAASLASLPGSAGFAKTGGNTLTLTGDNSYTGGTMLGGGTLSLGSANAIGSSGAIAFNGGALQFNGVNTTDYSSRFSTADGQNFSFDTNGQSVTLASALTSSGGSLTKYGAGTLTLAAANAYTGNTTVRAGTLALDFSQATAPTSDIINSASTMTLRANGGQSTLLIQGKDGTANSQTFAGITARYGKSSVVAASGAGGTMDVNLGAISRNWNALIDFTLPASGYIVTSTPNADYTAFGGQQTVLPGWVTVGNSTWAVSGSGATAGAITGLASYSSTFTAAADVDAPTGASTPDAMTINSLRFNNAGAASVSVGSGSGDLVIANGGILVTSNVGAHNITLTCGTLGSQNGGCTDLSPGGTGSILAVIQNNPLGTLTINAAMDGSGAESGRVYGLDKFGDGTLILEGDKLSYAGGTTIQGGTLIFRNISSLNSLSIGDNANLVFDQTSTDCTFANGIGGVGNLAKTGAYKLTLSSSDNSYLGSTTVGGGTLSIDSAYLSDTANVSIAAGAALDLNFAGTDTIKMLYLNGMAAAVGTWGAAGSGAEFTSSLLTGSGMLNVTAVPEPGALALLASGLVGLIAYAWRKRK